LSSRDRRGAAAAASRRVTQWLRIIAATLIALAPLAWIAGFHGYLSIKDAVSAPREDRPGGLLFGAVMIAMGVTVAAFTWQAVAGFQFKVPHYPRTRWLARCGSGSKLPSR
jgi:hypothetical protein